MTATDGPGGLPGAGFRLDGQVALITGASKNIGAAMTMAFAEAGSDLVVVARGAEALAALAAHVARAHPGRRIVHVTGDLAKPEDVERIAAAALDAFGRIDTLVNNAASIGVPSVAMEIAPGAMEEVFRTNLFGPFRATQILAQEMIRSGRGGSVINVLSGAGFQPVPRSLAYGASKAALWLMTRGLSVELAPLVRVNALVPGLISEDGKPANVGHDRMVESVIPFRRMGRPEEVAGAAVYLASPAASYTSGTVIFCNGARLW